MATTHPQRPIHNHLFSTTTTLLALLFSLSLLLAPCAAQFQFFDQMFQQQQHQAHQQQQPRQANAPSDSNWYQHTYQGATCDKYLCPGTLSCVHFPHHCPCAWPAFEEKVELGEGAALCASRGGWAKGEVAKKVELARKGVL